MLFNSFLVLHIAFGFLALCAGLLAAITQKGGKAHLLSGKVFAYSMYAVGVSALVLTLIKPNSFLMSVGFFTLYLTYAGQKAIGYYRLRTALQPGWKDKLPVYAGLLVALYMVAKPVWQMLQQGQFHVSVSLVFGSILLLSVQKDLRTLRQADQFKPGNKQWLLRHIGMISGAYIAACTAFVVTNIQFSPGWVLWLAPTVIGSVFISVNTRAWRKKLRLSSVVVALYLAGLSTTFAQSSAELSGRVTNAAGEGIEFVNVGFLNTSVGTITDQNGYYNLEFEPALAAESPLKFSAIGYEASEMMLQAARGEAPMNVTLQEKAYTLQAVVVKPLHTQLKTLGNTSEKSVMYTNLAIHGKPNMNLGSSIGRKFKLRKKRSYQIKEMHVHIAGSNYDTLLLRFNFYSIQSGKPHELLHEQNITQELVGFRKGWVQVDLEPYNLLVNQSIIASVEWIGASQRGDRLFLNMHMPSIGATHYYKYGAQNKWKMFPNMSTSMFLVLDEEKD